MNMHKMKLAVGLFVLAVLVPAPASAYLTTDQAAVKLGDSVGLFTVTYSFGHGDRDMLLPIMAVEEAETAGQVGYVFLDDDDEVLSEQSAVGIVLTGDETVTVENGQYRIPAGERAAFTLLVLLEAGATQPDTSLLVSHLPFTMVIDGRSIENQLNDSELQYYRTPELSF